MACFSGCCAFEIVADYQACEHLALRLIQKCRQQKTTEVDPKNARGHVPVQRRGASFTEKLKATMNSNKRYLYAWHHSLKLSRNDENVSVHGNRPPAWYHYTEKLAFSLIYGISVNLLIAAYAIHSTCSGLLDVFAVQFTDMSSP